MKSSMLSTLNELTEDSWSIDKICILAFQFLRGNPLNRTENLASTTTTLSKSHLLAELTSLLSMKGVNILSYFRHRRMFALHTSVSHDSLTNAIFRLYSAVSKPRLQFKELILACKNLLTIFGKVAKPFLLELTMIQRSGDNNLLIISDWAETTVLSPHKSSPAKKNQSLTRSIPNSPSINRNSWDGHIHPSGQSPPISEEQLHNLSMSFEHTKTYILDDSSYFLRYFREFTTNKVQMKRLLLLCRLKNLHFDLSTAAQACTSANNEAMEYISIMADLVHSAIDLDTTTEGESPATGHELLSTLLQTTQEARLCLKQLRKLERDYETKHKKANSTLMSILTAQHELHAQLTLIDSIFSSSIPFPRIDEVSAVRIDVFLFAVGVKEDLEKSLLSLAIQTQAKHILGSFLVDWLQHEETVRQIVLDMPNICDPHMMRSAGVVIPLAYFPSKSLQSCSINSLIDVGYTYEEFLDAKIGVVDLIRQGCEDVKVLRRIGVSWLELQQTRHFALVDLITAGCNHDEIEPFLPLIVEKIKVQKPIFSLSDLRQLGFSCQELIINHSISPSQLKIEGGYTLQEFIIADLHLKELKKAGFKAQELRQAGYTFGHLAHSAGYALTDLCQAGFTVEEFITNGVTFVSDLYEAGFTEQELYSFGFTVEELRDGGVKLSTLLEAGLCSVNELQGMRLSIFDMLKTGVTVKEILAEGGYTINELLASGAIGIGDLLRAGVAPHSLRQVGVHCDDLRQAGVSLRKLKQAGYSAQELQRSGAGLRELVHVAGFDVPELVETGAMTVNHRSLLKLF